MRQRREGAYSVPIYTYQCTDCGVRFERRQHMADPAIVRCPACRRGRVRRVIGQVAVVYTGRGFYVTDTRSDHD